MSSELKKLTCRGLLLCLVVQADRGFCQEDGAWELPRPPERLATIRHPKIAKLRNFVYWLDNVDLDALGRTSFECAIIDPCADGTETSRFSATEIRRLKRSSGGDKLVLAYLSIGEAEDYRLYWQKEAGGSGADWAASPPGWLGPENPDWGGNFKVRYWQREWQQIIVHNPGKHPVLENQKSALDRILDADFDGVYLDVVDAFEYWGPEEDGGNGERPSSASDMAAFVRSLADHARARVPGFVVCPQNGARIIAADLEHPLSPSERRSYLSSIDALGVEDVFFGDGSREDGEFHPDPERIGLIDEFRAAGKQIFATEYLGGGPSGGGRDELRLLNRLCRARGWVPLLAGRELNSLPDAPDDERD